LFLDEPTVGLDPRIRFELLDLVARIRDRGDTTIMLTTHYLDEADRLCDRVAIVHAGRIVALDRPAALLEQLGDAIVEVRVERDAAVVLAALRRYGIAGDDAYTVGTTIYVPIRNSPAADLVARIAALDIRAVAVTTRSPTLDDVYLHITGDRIAA
jgi:ABC-2 type transport system ATP-binding protein